MNVFDWGIEVWACDGSTWLLACCEVCLESASVALNLASFCVCFLLIVWLFWFWSWVEFNCCVDLVIWLVCWFCISDVICESLVWAGLVWLWFWSCFNTVEVLFVFNLASGDVACWLGVEDTLFSSVFCCVFDSEFSAACAWFCIPKNRVTPISVDPIPTENFRIA